MKKKIAIAVLCVLWTILLVLFASCHYDIKILAKVISDLDRFHPFKGTAYMCTYHYC